MSPMAQKPLAGMLNGYIFNGFRRIMSQAPKWVVPLGLGELRGVPCRVSADGSGYWAYVWGSARSVTVRLHPLTALCSTGEADEKVRIQ